MSVLQIAMAVGGRRVVPKQPFLRIQSDRKLSILVADDNRTNQLVLSKVLERAGHTVTAVENGAAAVEALRSNSFDVAIMDLNMPVLNGVDAFRQYRRNGWAIEFLHPSLRSLRTQHPEASARCAEVGFQACATKPIEPQRLLELISQGRNAVLHRSRVTGVGFRTGSTRNRDIFRACTGKAKVRRETLRKLEQLGGRTFC